MMKKGLLSKPTSFTGRTRVRKTTRRVKFANVTARLLISLGGIAKILAVLLGCESHLLSLFVTRPALKNAPHFPALIT